MHCGARLEGAQAAFLSNCPRCGAMLAGGRGAGPMPFGGPPIRAPSSSSGVSVIFLVLGGVAAFVVLGGVLLALVLGARSSSASTEPQALNAPPVEVATIEPVKPKPPPTATPTPTAAPTPTTPPTPTPIFTGKPPPPPPTFTVPPRPTVPPPPPTTTVTATSSAQPRRFDRISAQAQMNAAASQVQACKLPDAPTGSNVITVVFSPSGSAIQVTYASGPLVDPRLTSCITPKFLRIRVEPFDGPVERISRSITITAGTAGGA